LKLSAPSAVSRLKVDVAEAELGAVFGRLDTVEILRVQARWIARRIQASTVDERNLVYVLFAELAEEQRAELLGSG
jgi:hypothetical protein